VRDQIELRAVDLDRLVAADHPVRVIWDYVQGLGAGLAGAGGAGAGAHAGSGPGDAEIAVALWLYATVEGVGSARALDRLCESHDAYRWLCGGVSVNYHSLSDFRTADPELLDRLLSESGDVVAPM